MEDTKVRRSGRLQRSLLDALASGPLTRQELRQRVDARADNFGRSLAILLSEGKVRSSDGAFALASDDDRQPPFARPYKGYRPYGSTPWVTAYRELTQLFIDLASGEELHLPDDPHHPMRLHVVDQLLAQGVLVRQGPRASLTVADPKALKRIWADERAFCTLAGWEIEAQHAEHMAALLRGGDRRSEAAAATHLYRVIGQNNTARRTGLSPEHISALRTFATLPDAVQAHLESRGLHVRAALHFRFCRSEDEMLSKLAELEGAETTPTEPDESRTASVNDDAPVSDRQLLETCVKLCAAVAEIAAELNRKVDWLAKELGYADAG